VRHLSRKRGVDLVGVHDTDQARAAAVAAELGTRPFHDLDALLHQVRAVTIAVPTSVHGAVGLRALEAGVPVLMEKPLAGTLAEADELVGAAEARGLQLQVGHIERFNRAIRAARSSGEVRSLGTAQAPVPPRLRLAS
jgi:predicted dehydrogenase